MLKKILGLLLVIFFFMPNSVFAQATDGKIVGRITDISDASIVGAAVKIVNKDTGLSFTATTDDQGEIYFEHLPVGIYLVTADAANFKRAAAEIQTALNRTIIFVLKLEPGEVTDTIEVRDKEALIDIKSFTIGGTF